MKKKSLREARKIIGGSYLILNKFNVAHAKGIAEKMGVQRGAVTSALKNLEKKIDQL